MAVCDSERKHRQRGEGIVEKARGRRPESYGDPRKVFDRNDIDAVVVALPCDAHDQVYAEALAAGKAPLRREAAVNHARGLRPADRRRGACTRLWSSTSASSAGRTRGFARAIELISRGELGPLVEARASWTSSNGPINGHDGWLARRERSGDWMVEQGVHIWDVFHWLKGTLAREGDRLGPPRSIRVDRSRAQRHRPLLGRPGVGRRLPRLVRAELDRPRR